MGAGAAGARDTERTEGPMRESAAESGAGAEAGGEGPFRRRFRRGARAFGAFREALGDTIREARERGDFAPDRAREVMRDAVGRAREATHDARERFDFVTRGEYETLVRRVRELEDRVREAESGGE